MNLHISSIRYTLPSLSTVSPKADGGFRLLVSTQTADLICVWAANVVGIYVKCGQLNGN